MPKNYAMSEDFEIKLSNIAKDWEQYRELEKFVYELLEWYDDNH